MFNQLKESRLALCMVPLCVVIFVITPCMAALSDPTKPAYLQKKNVIHKKIIKKKYKPLVVKSILLSSEHKSAVINDSVVGVGDKIDSATVIEITRNYVVVQRNNRKQILLFGKTIAGETRVKSKLK